MQKLRNTYYILRHGENIYQVKKKGWTYPRADSSKVGLTKNGKKQVMDSVGRLADKKIDLIFSSDFFRTAQTAKIAAKEIGLTKISLDKRLRDINFGIYQSRKMEDLYKRFPRRSMIRFSKKPPGGESWDSCQRRIVNFLKEIDRKYNGKTILIIGHGDPLWLLEGWVKNLSKLKMLKTKDRNFIQVGELRKLYGI